MVDSLAARLDSGEGGAQEWARLVRAYVVLKEPSKAASTLAKARSALAGDKAALAGLDDLARELGLGG
jgi:cytochrome c-type biogenesis protein CcmH